MAKKTKYKNTARRGNLTPTANLRLPRLLPRSMSVARGLPDRRNYHPDGMMAPLAVTSRLSSKLVHGVSRGSTKKSNRNVPRYGGFKTFTPSSVAFKAPSRVVLCVKRQQRKEVIHAIGKAGRSGQRKPRRNQWSDVSCKAVRRGR